MNPIPRVTAACLTIALLVGCAERDGTDLALGTLERDRIALTATVSEVLVELPVRRGMPVAEGTVLARLDDRLQRATVARSRADLAHAEARLSQLRNGARPQDIAAARASLAGKEAALREEQIVLDRNEKLLSTQSVSQAEYDRSLALRDAAQARADQAQEGLDELLAGTRIEEIQQAEADVAAAAAQLSYEEARLAELTIIATRDGVLDNLPWNLGERVTAGSPLAVMLAAGAPYARVYVPARHRTAIRQGETLTVRVDGDDTDWEGTVRWISAEPAFTPYYALSEGDRSRLVYLAEVALPQAASDLPSGVPAQVVMP